MQQLNLSNCKKCALCKYWYDPTNSAISPKSPQINIWEYDEKAKNMCLQKGITISANASCSKYQCKLEII